MADKSLLQEFLKGLLGRGNPDTPLPSPSEPAPILAKTLPPRSQAYLQRKKGRKLRDDPHEDLKRIAACLQQKPEVTPAEMAEQLGMARSTLAYNLKRLMKASQSPSRVGWHRYQPLDPDYVRGRLFAGKRLEKLGGGKYVRYRLVENPPGGPETAPKSTDGSLKP